MNEEKVVAVLAKENEVLRAKLARLTEANEELFFRFTELSKTLREYEEQNRYRRFEKL